MAPEIEQGTLADAGTDPFGVDEAIGEVAVAAAAGTGLGCVGLIGARASR